MFAFIAFCESRKAKTPHISSTRESGSRRGNRDGTSTVVAHDSHDVVIMSQGVRWVVRVEHRQVNQQADIMKAISVGVCSDMLTMVREQTLRSDAASLPTSGTSAPWQSGANVVQPSASEKRLEAMRQ